MCDVFHLDPTWIHLDLPIWGIQGTLWPDVHHLWLFGAISGRSLYGTSGWIKRLKHIHLDVSHLDPTWIHLDPPIWSLQGGLWPNMPHLWQIGAVFGQNKGKMAIIFWARFAWQTLDVRKPVRTENLDAPNRDGHAPVFFHAASMSPMSPPYCRRKSKRTPFCTALHQFFS